MQLAMHTFCSPASMFRTQVIIQGVDQQQIQPGVLVQAQNGSVCGCAAAAASATISGINVCGMRRQVLYV
jgi:hypothetical protein